MKVAVFSAHSFDKEHLTRTNEKFGHELTFFEAGLNNQTASLAGGFPCVCCFVNDLLDRKALEVLNGIGVKLIALRSAGYNNVDLQTAARLGLSVVRVPAYSPHAVAEHAVALILALNRKIYRAYERTRELNFSLDGLVGFDLYGKTVGIVGTGKIGSVMARIMRGFGCEVLAFDPRPDKALSREAGIRYVTLADIYRHSDIISLHLPLLPETKHLIDADAIAKMKPGVMIINTGRGALIDAKALIDALKSGQVGYAGLDVYEEEEGVFYQNLSDHVLQDDVLARLLTFPNVLITAHQAFLTNEALTGIATTTLQNITDYENKRALTNEISAHQSAASA